MKNERMMALLDRLLNEGRATAAELAKRFEVSERTIYRDIDSLCMAGVPVVAEPGAGGGYSIDPGYRVDRSFLTRDEIIELSTLLRGMPEALKDTHIDRSLGKIASLGPRAGDPVNGGDGSGLPLPFMATLSPWSAPGPDPLTVISLRKSIADRKVVSFQYTDGESRQSERTVEPFSIILEEQSGTCTGTASFVPAGDCSNYPEFAPSDSAPRGSIPLRGSRLPILSPRRASCLWMSKLRRLHSSSRLWPRPFPIA